MGQRKMRIRERKEKRKANLRRKTRKGKTKRTKKVGREREKAKAEMPRKTKVLFSTRQISCRRSAKYTRRTTMCGLRVMNREISHKSMMWSSSRNRRGKKWRKRCEPKSM